MAISKSDLLQGTLDLLILQTLQKGPLHGWGISRHIRERTRDVLNVNQGSLYPALYRLEDRGVIAGSDALSEQGRRVRVYKLTAAGKRELAVEQSLWRQFAAAVDLVLQPA
ncbi:MAG: PadR family transcriptional regulator [Gemmatimonadota bacterium]